MIECERRGFNYSGTSYYRFVFNTISMKKWQLLEVKRMFWFVTFLIIDKEV